MFPNDNFNHSPLIDIQEAAFKQGVITGITFSVGAMLVWSAKKSAVKTRVKKTFNQN